MKGNKRIRNDIILLAALLALAFAAWGAIALTRSSGSYVVVELDGTELAKYPLSEDVKVDIRSFGGHFNTLVISDGKAEIVDANCPDKLCVKQHAVSRAGETIICLPHKLIIRIEGESGVDAVS